VKQMCIALATLVALAMAVPVRSRMIPDLFVEKFRSLLLLVFHGLHRSFMSQGPLRNMLVV
jgi:hypothetical protein